MNNRDHDLTTIARMTGVLVTGARHPGALAADRQALRRARQRQETLNVLALGATVGALMFTMILGSLA